MVLAVIIGASLSQNDNYESNGGEWILALEFRAVKTELSPLTRRRSLSEEKKIIVQMTSFIQSISSTRMIRLNTIKIFNLMTSDDICKL